MRRVIEITRYAKNYQVKKFASRMGKYQDNEDKMEEELSRARVEVEKLKEKLERALQV